MAVLTDEARWEVWADAMRRYSDEGTVVTIAKSELRAAVDALDTYMNDNAAAINAALPQPARGALSIEQKALLLTAVVHRRYLDGE